MKNKSLVFGSIILICAFSPIAVKGQSLPHTFTANTAAKASEVNENFKYLLERFGTRKTTVNCYSGESITTALQNYNHIIISGVCTENLDLDATKLAHRLIILEGSSSSSDGITAKDTSNPVIKIYYGGITLKASKLKLTSGKHGLLSALGPTIILENVLVENNTSTGIKIRASVGVIKDSTIQNNGGNAIQVDYSGAAGIEGNTISGHTSNSSIKITRGSSADINKNTITNGKYAGISVDRGSFSQIGKDPDSGVSRGNTIQSADNGISVEDSSHAILKYNTVKNNSKNGLSINNNGSVILAQGNTFTNNTEYGINLWLGGSLNMWCDAQLTSATTISSNTKGAIQVSDDSKAGLCNLSLSIPKNGIQAGMGAYLNIRNITITNSQGDGISLWGAKGQIDNATITGSSNAGIRLNNGFLSIRNSTISGSTKGGISSHQQSAINLNGGVIIENNGYGIGMHNSTLFQYDNQTTSYIRNNTGNEISATMSSIGFNNVTVGGTSGSTEINLSQGSILRIETGTSITGSIWCDGSLNTGKFIDDSITLNPTNSGC